MKLKLSLELDDGPRDFIQAGELADLLHGIGRAIEDSEETTHPRTPIYASGNRIIGHWEVS